MQHTDKEDTGTIQALLERLNKWRLPRALELKERVDTGDLLEEADIDFLQRVIEDATKAKSLIDRHPELQKLGIQLVDLYSHITAKGLENEQSKKN